MKFSSLSSNVKCIASKPKKDIKRLDSHDEEDKNSICIECYELIVHIVHIMLFRKYNVLATQSKNIFKTEYVV